VGYFWPKNERRVFFSLLMVCGASLIIVRFSAAAAVPRGEDETAISSQPTKFWRKGPTHKPT
jgi:hypothetical protein